MRFNGQFGGTIRCVAWAVATIMTWSAGPASAFASAPPKYKPISRLAAKGLTDTPDAALRAKIDAKEKKEKAAHGSKTQAPVRILTKEEMSLLSGSGSYRNSYFAGAPMPWHRSFHDVNMCTGNLYKNFTDIQIAPARGAGLTLNRSYSSQDDREGPFGTGWTHAYDIRMDEAGPSPTDADVEEVPRTDFFGGKHTYTRDADGLYTPPAYMFDELDSTYDNVMASGPSAAMEDIQKGMDGTTKHFVDNGTKADSTPNYDERVCDYIEDRHGNRTNLAYATVTCPDGSTWKRLSSVTDPSGREIDFVWSNLGTTSDPHWRITEVDGPSGTYRVTYDYYTNSSDPASYLNLHYVHLDPDGLNRTTTYTYTSYTGDSGTENGLLASVSDPLSHTVSYQYDLFTGYYEVSPGNTLRIRQITEPTEQGNHIWHFETFQYADNRFGGASWVSRVHDNGVWDMDSGLTGGATVAVQIAVDSQFRTTATLCGGVTDEFVYFSGFYTLYDNANNPILSEQIESPVTTVPVFRTSPWSYTGGDGANAVQSTYGPHGNVLSQSNVFFSGETTSYTYYDASKYFQKASVTDANGHTTSFDYYDDQDANGGNRGEVKWVRDAGYAVSGSPSYGKQFDYTYNSYGQKASETNLNGVVTKYTYGDSWGNLTQVVQDPSTTSPSYTGLDRTTSMSYDVAGKVLSSTDPNGRTSTFAYNALGQPSSASFPAVMSGSTTVTPAETISYTYGDNGRTATVTDNRGTTSISYASGCDRVASVTDPVTGTTSYTYTLSGERKTVTLPDNKTWTIHYQQPDVNPLDLRLDMEFPTPAQDLPVGIKSVGLCYMLPKDDPNSISLRPLSITDEDGRTAYFDLSTRGAMYGTWEDLSYTNDGTLSKYFRVTTAPDGAFHSEDGYFEADSTLDPVTFKTHFATGNVRNVWCGDADNFPTHRTLLCEYGYTYNAQMQRTSCAVGTQAFNPDTTPNRSYFDDEPVAQTIRTESYSYDALNRLTSVNYGDGQTQSYSFDAMGNRSSMSNTITGSGTTTTGYTYNAANMLLTRGTSGYYSNDANGNTLTDADGRTNTWDSQNRLAKVVVSGGSTTEFTYGTDGLRRRKFVTDSGGAQTQTDYVIDGQDVVEEVVKHRTSSTASWSTATTISYLQGPGGPLYRLSSAATDPSWYVYDGLGSVVGEVSVTGTLTASESRDVYGNLRSSAGTQTTNHGFVGGLGHQTDDETGLVYMRARYYDPTTGRFNSEDTKCSGDNWFAYCNSDPVNRVDQTGKEGAPVSDIIQTLNSWLKSNYNVQFPPVIMHIANLLTFIGIVTFAFVLAENVAAPILALGLLCEILAGPCLGVAVIGLIGAVILAASIGLACIAGEGIGGELGKMFDEGEFDWMHNPDYID